MKRVLILFAITATSLLGQWGGDLRFCLRSDPKTFNPLLVEDEASETVRYLTGGVLVRVNRLTQELEPELATSWKISRQGRAIAFQLRHGVVFSDGTPFTADDVAYTMHALMDPALHSPTGDSFRSAPGDLETTVQAPDRITILFPAPVAGLERLFDQVAITSGRSPLKIAAVLGPYRVAEYKPGSEILLARNPNYWKVDSKGVRLPYHRPPSPGDPTESRHRACPIPPWRGGSDQRTRPGCFRRIGPPGARIGSRRRTVAGIGDDVVQPGRQVSPAGL